MSRYFFHLRRGQVTVLDQEGVELASIEDAAKEAGNRVDCIKGCPAWCHGKQQGDRHCRSAMAHADGTAILSLRQAHAN
jgi:hypothetical protein